MEQRVKEHLAETHAKTMFYIAYGTVFFIFPLGVSLLSRLVMGAAWRDKYNTYIMGAGFGVAVILAEVIAKRVSNRTKK